MSRLSCVQSCICPDYRAFKVTYDQTIVRSKLHISGRSCVQNCLCPDYSAFKIAYVQTIVRSKLPMIRLSCVQICICPDCRAFKIAYVQTIVRSKLLMSRLSCVQNCTCPYYRAFQIAYVQTIVRSKLHMSRLSCVHFFPDRVILNARRHLVRSFRCGRIDFWSGTSTWVAIGVSYMPRQLVCCRLSQNPTILIFAKRSKNRIKQTPEIQNIMGINKR